MANRSDFFNAKLPRQYKRMFAMGQTYGWTGNEHSRGLLKRQFISAHANHVNFKLKRQSAETNSSEE